jgi:hypothetical protein
MDRITSLLGLVLGTAYFSYGIWLALATLFGGHLLLLAVLLATRFFRLGSQSRWVDRPAGLLRLPVELAYGLFNPILYLTILTPNLEPQQYSASSRWMNAAAWITLSAIWGARFLAPRDWQRRSQMMEMLARLCALGTGLVVLFGIRDLLIWHSAELLYSRVATLWLTVSLPALYLVPALLLDNWRIRLRREQVPAGFILLPRRAALFCGVLVAGLVLATVIAANMHPSDGSALARVAQLRPAIDDSARRYHVDPKIIGAIVYATQHDQAYPLRDHLERLAMTVFLVDDASHFLLAKPFDLSVGVAQIKPVTAMTALGICQKAGKTWNVFSKHMRDVPALGKEWNLGQSGRNVCEAPIAMPVGKPEVVAALEDDNGNVTFAALILWLYEAQWREADPAWDISQRPDILATLYQIGFERSHPHLSPQSNAFGQRVAEVYREPWLQTVFAH